MTEQLTFFDLHREETTGDHLRDQGIARVMENNELWTDRAFVAAIQLPSGEYTGEDIRLAICDDVGEPEHCNAWGGLVSRLVKSNIIQGTGRYRKMKSPKSHSRKTEVYKK